jgi:hypothetical protein
MATAAPPRTHRAGPTWLPALAAISLGAGAGLTVSLHSAPVGPLARIAAFPLPILVAVLLVPILTLITLRRPWFGFWVFMLWLPFEDLFRKYAGNDIRLYAVKELLFIVAMIGLAKTLRREHSFRAAVGRAWLPTVVLIAWAIAMSARSAFSDVRVPIVGLRLDFLYLPLVGVGYLFMRTRSSARRALRWLTVLSAGVLMLGVVQAVVGPGFLSPGRATPGLGHLVLRRGFGTDLIYRPTGTFVDPGRYATMAVVGLAIALAYYTSRGVIRARLSIIAGVGLTATATWVSGARTAVLAGFLLVVVAVVAHRRRTGRRTRRAAVAALAAAAVALGVLGVAYPKLFTSQSQFYGSTLDPRSSRSEWAFRWKAYTNDAVRGIGYGKVIGQGTGTQSLGLQYLYGGEDRSVNGLYHLESGYGTVAYEWGVIGFGLWLWWTAAWLLRLRASLRKVQFTHWYTAGAVLSAWIFFFLVLEFAAGMAYFQNYVTNAFFWLLSGVVMGLPQIVHHEHEALEDVLLCAS